MKSSLPACHQPSTCVYIFQISKHAKPFSYKVSWGVFMKQCRIMSLFGHGSRNQKTIRLKKGALSGSKGSQLKKHIDATLGSGNLQEAVKLPPGEDLNEWLAVNTVDFCNQVNILYGTLTEFCTSSTCPLMSAGPKYEYRWTNGITIKKPTVVSAWKYVEHLMDWIECQLDNESIFPQKLGVPFPP